MSGGAFYPERRYDTPARIRENIQRCQAVRAEHGYPTPGTLVDDTWFIEAEARRQEHVVRWIEAATPPEEEAAS